MPTKKKWSQDVTEHSDALALEPDVFKSDDPKEIAKSHADLLYQPRRQDPAAEAQEGA
jgi:hypothetical protein